MKQIFLCCARDDHAETASQYLMRTQQKRTNDGVPIKGRVVRQSR